MKNCASASGLYGTRWRKLRRLYLKANPLCKMCTEDGALTPATELDHIVKHNGDRVLFYDVDNLQGLCAIHHRGFKAKAERSGRVAPCDLKGYPTKPNKYW